MSDLAQVEIERDVADAAARRAAQEGSAPYGTLFDRRG
jgi:hypothetical protein